MYFCQNLKIEINKRTVIKEQFLWRYGRVVNKMEPQGKANEQCRFDASFRP